MPAMFTIGNGLSTVRRRGQARRVHRVPADRQPLVVAARDPLGRALRARGPADGDAVVGVDRVRVGVRATAAGSSAAASTASRADRAGRVRRARARGPRAATGSGRRTPTTSAATSRSPIRSAVRSSADLARCRPARRSRARGTAPATARRSARTRHAARYATTSSTVLGNCTPRMSPCRAPWSSSTWASRSHLAVELPPGEPPRLGTDEGRLVRRVDHRDPLGLAPHLGAEQGVHGVRRPPTAGGVVGHPVGGVQPASCHGRSSASGLADGPARGQRGRPVAARVRGHRAAVQFVPYLLEMSMTSPNGLNSASAADHWNGRNAMMPIGAVGVICHFTPSMNIGGW